MATRHYLPDQMLRAPVSVLLVGCGGNGAQMLMGLASLDIALRALGRPGLHVTTIDDDVVTSANLGRQPFFQGDVGAPKAEVLTTRINLAHGLAWRAQATRLTPHHKTNSDLIIGCVDNAQGRLAINAMNGVGWGYLLDLGNGATTGQFAIGRRRPSWEKRADATRLASPYELFPELLDPTLDDATMPSCSVAEALERQSLFINRTLASHALALLFELLGRGSIGRAGGYINIDTGNCAAIPLKNAAEVARDRKDRERRARRRKARLVAKNETGVASLMAA